MPVAVEENNENNLKNGFEANLKKRQHKVRAKKWILKCVKVLDNSDINEKNVNFSGVLK